MKKYLTKVLFVLPLLLVLSCGEEESFTLTQQSSNVPLKITINTPQDNQITQTANLEDFLEFVTTVSVIVQGDFPTISQLFSIGEPVIIFVPPGENRTFIVSLLNSDGQAVCSGQTTVDIVPGVTNEISIDCEVVDEVCDDGVDNNGNDLEDCEEDVCAGSQCDTTNINICIDNECSPPIPDNEIDCDDGVDNDEDGFTDCEDTECSDEEDVCVEVSCADETDNDNDGDTDCEDVDCGFDPICEEVCDDDIDNDADGNADCLDDECNNQNCDSSDPNLVCIDNECTTEGEVDCDDGVDNDGDELIDCDDLEDCEGRVCFEGNDGSACVIVEIEGSFIGECQEIECNDDDNNDGDDLFGEFPAVDCDDEDCDGEPCGDEVGAQCDFNGEGGDCEEVNCFDQVDNDFDESIDCDDANDCGFFERPCGTGAGGAGANCGDDGGQTFTFECQENACDNQQDDDRDQLIDCLDPDCDLIDGEPGSGTNQCEFGKENTCDDGFDNDANEGIDCADPDCDFSGESGFCEPGGGTGAACSFIDQGECDEINCKDGIDNDGNEGTDCADPDCGFNGESGADCSVSGLSFSAECEANDQDECDEVDCADGIDNDGNEGIDCADPDCASAQNCGQQMSEMICDDGIDNDGNEGIDCLDPDCDNRDCASTALGSESETGAFCDFAPAGGPPNECDETNCSDGLDNDGNEGADCADPDCNAMGCGTGLGCFNSECQEVLCTDDVDNDDDGFTDCDDLNCQNRPCEDPQSLGARCSLGGMGEGVGNGECIERFCGDGIDNDMDGDGQTLIDCLDPDCNGTQCGSQFPSGSSCQNMVCSEIGSGCSDGNDNDDDGDIDCVDTDCPCPQGSVCNQQTGVCET